MRPRSPACQQHTGTVSPVTLKHGRNTNINEITQHRNYTGEAHYPPPPHLLDPTPLPQIQPPHPASRLWNIIKNDKRFKLSTAFNENGLWLSSEDLEQGLCLCSPPDHVLRRAGTGVCEVGEGRKQRHFILYCLINSVKR